MNRPYSRHRFAFAGALITAASLAIAQNALPPPPGLEPLPEIPPPPGVAADTGLEPQVTVTRKDGATFEEARVNEKIVWIKVTPSRGRPYFLIPDSNGALMRRESLDTTLKVPMWLLLEW